MSKTRFILLMLTWASLSSAAQLFVAPNGSDENPGSKEAPFATLGRARDVVRGMLDQEITVYLREGTYPLTETVVIGLLDSGNESCRITYAGYPGETARLTSLSPITGWSLYADTAEQAKGNIWVADMPHKMDRFYTLQDAQGMLPRARGKGFEPVDKGQLDAAVPIKRYESIRNLYFPEGALKDWPNMEDVEIIIRPYFRWTMNILPIAWVDEEQQLARTALPGTYPLLPVKEAKTDGTVWVENVLDVLDEPGEWCINTRERKVYLWARDSKKPEGIAAPLLRELIRVEGQIDKRGSTDIPVRNIAFENLTFTGGDRDLWTPNDAGIQHDFDMYDKPNALLRFRGAENCLVKDCIFEKSGGNAVRLDLHAQRITVTGNEIRDLGACGILLIGYGPGTKDVNHHNVVENNLIHDCGSIYWHSHGIVAWQSGFNKIAHNTIYDMPRKGICITGVRGYSFKPRYVPWRECNRTIRWHEVGGRGSEWKWPGIIKFLHSRNNVIEYNDIYRVLKRMGDGSAINISGAGDNNVVRRNFVHDIDTMESVSACYRADDFQRKTRFEENVALRSNIAGFVFSGGGWSPDAPGDNHLVNNIAVDVAGDNLLAGCMRLWQVKSSVAGSVYERNIFYQPVKEATFYRLAGVETDYIAGCKVANNILYDQGADVEGGKSANLETIRSVGVAKTDRYTDPMFVDWENGDFRFKPGSPAPAMGIVDIDVSKAGITDAFPKR